MSDSAQAQQRNLYNKDITSYRDGNGLLYMDQLLKVSWPISTDVPAHAQVSAQPSIRDGWYRTLHPMEFMQKGDYTADSFTNTYGSFGIRSDGDPTCSVHQRLYTPSRSVARAGARTAASQAEQAGDAAFSNGRVEEAIKMFSLGIQQKPTLFAYEKRCAAYAHLGRYSEALGDAEFILKNGPPGGEQPAARFRVKAIKDYLRKKTDTGPGHHHATATLMCILTPREHRQWRSVTPSPYTRPYTFGTSASNFGI